MSNKQVGTKPYQTPRNADLGTLAYQDADSTILRLPTIVGNDNEDLLRFNKTGGVTVGVVGVNSSDNFTISATTGGGAGLMFWGAGGTDPLITPMKENQTSTIGDVDLGRTANRFGRLFLTTGVSLSATSDTLDTYDEGTFHPFSGNDTIANIYHATYVRIGNECHIHTNFQMKAGQSRNFISLPFTPENSSLGNNGTVDATANRYAGTVAYFTPAGGSVPVSIDLFHQGNQGANAYFIARSNTTSQTWPYSVSDANGNVAVQFTYLINT